MSWYADRDRWLKKMGYPSYTAYLDSELWQSIRAKVLERDKGLCRVCDKPARSVHHDDYSPNVLRGKFLKPLYSLCHGCHRRIEFDVLQKDRKLPPDKVAKKLKRLLKMRAGGKRKGGKKRTGGKPWIGLAHKAKWLRRRGLM